MSSEIPFPSKLIHEIHSHSGPVNAITFSHSGGTYVLTGSSDRQIHLARTEPSNTQLSTTTNPIQRYVSHGYPVLDISITLPNTHFASCSADRSGPFYWDINVPESTIRRFGATSPSPHTSRITCLSFAANDSVLVSGSDDTSVRLWDCKSKDSRPLMVLNEAKDGITALKCFGNEIITGSSDGRVRSYDVRVGRILQDTQPGVVTSLCLGNEGRTVLVGCLDGKLRLMDRENGSCLRTFPSETQGEPSGLLDYVNKDLRLQSCLADRDKLVVSGNEVDGTVRAWNVLTSKLVGSVNTNSNNKVVSVVRWREASSVENVRGVLATGGADGIVRMYAGAV